VLDGVRGNVSLKGEDSGDIRISGRKSIRALNRAAADRADRDTRVHLDRQGDLLVIRTEGAGGGLQITTDLDITVPKGISVESRGRSGDLTIDDIVGTVDIASGRGDVRVSHIGNDVKIGTARGGSIHGSDLAGAFDLQGRGGDVELNNIAGPVTISGEYSGTLEFRALAKPFRFQSARTEFNAEAVPGTITLDLGNLKMSNVFGPVRFQTGSRDIDASDITNALDLSVDRGDIRVTASKVPLPKIDLRSRHGDISLVLPDKAGFQLKASALQGDAENDYGAPLATQSDGHSATIQGETGHGPQITAVTDRGTVSVKKT
jgi:DUF4097 and DUF4098 domain-containing protein YvlB